MTPALTSTAEPGRGARRVFRQRRENKGIRSALALMYAVGPEIGVVVMPEGLWPILILIAIVIVWVIAKIRHYMKVSDEQWRAADKSKLREWEDDDD